MDKPTLGAIYLNELEAEATATRKCLERVPPNLFDYKPHEKSMPMGRLALVIAEIPRWIGTAIDPGEINFGSFKHPEIKTTDDILREFDADMVLAKKALEKVSDEDLQKMFYLKNGDKVLMSDTRAGTISSSINHLVHHRGQLTVYLRLNNIPVPSIYGPSADETDF
jgi:uncharacterized damage-inducible protein DinB